MPTPAPDPEKSGDDMPQRKRHKQEEDNTSKEGNKKIPYYISQDVPSGLHPVGKIMAQREGSLSSLVLTIDTFLTDLYQVPQLFLELKSIDDTQANPRRGLLLEVFTPTNWGAREISNRTSLCHWETHQAGRTSRMRLTDFMVGPVRIVGHAPQWFLSHLEQRQGRNRQSGEQVATSPQEFFFWAHDISQYLAGGRVFIQQGNVNTKVRSWINE